MAASTTTIKQDLATIGRSLQHIGSTVVGSVKDTAGQVQTAVSAKLEQMRISRLQTRIDALETQVAEYQRNYDSGIPVSEQDIAAMNRSFVALRKDTDGTVAVSRSVRRLENRVYALNHPYMAAFTSTVKTVAVPVIIGFAAYAATRFCYCMNHYCASLL
jgi:hypothetical protein